MFCNKCGKSIPDGAKFCQSCGKPVGEASEPVNEQQTGPAAGQPTGTAGGFKFDVAQKPADRTGSFDPADVNACKGVSVVSYFGIFFFIPLIAKPDSKYCKFHANQGLVLMIVSAVLGIVKAIANAVISAVFTHVLSLAFWIPSMLTGVLNIAVGAVTLGLIIYGIVNAASGKAKELPVIGQIHLIDK